MSADAPLPTPLRIERLRARGGRLELLGEHLARFDGVAAEVARRDPSSIAGIENVAESTFERSGRRDGIVELCREALGSKPGRFHSYATPPADPEFVGERLAEGLRLLAAGERPALDGPKDGARLDRAHELLAQAAARGADELLWTQEGALVGATTMNLFLVRGATLVTPSLECGAWPGILRRAVLIAARQLATELRITVSEERLLPADLARADDAFLASSAHGIVAIAAIDGRPLPAPPRGSPARALVPKLRLRVHELCRDRFLPRE